MRVQKNKHTHMQTQNAGMPQRTEEFLDPNRLLRNIGVEQGSVVADFGCGTGYLSLPLSRHVRDNGKVYAIDVMKDNLASISDRALASGFRNVITVWADIEVPGATKINAQTVDMVIMKTVFFQLEKPREALAEAVRILKKGGKLAVIDWKKGAGPIGPPDDKRIPQEQIEEWAAAAKLKKTHDVEVDKYHYGMVFVK